MKPVFGLVQQAFVRGYVAEVRWRKTVYQLGAADDGVCVQAQPAIKPVATRRRYRSAQLLRQLPRRAECQKVDITDVCDEAVG